MLTKEQRDEIRARCDAATPGPWENGEYNSVSLHNGIKLCNMIRQGDAIFTAHARTDIPALLDALDEEKVTAQGWHYETQRFRAIVHETRADRDRWKARAEMFERAARNECHTCRSDENAENCTNCKQWSLWEFDEARFSKGGDNE